MSKISLIKIHGACSRLNLFWRCFEWRRNADHLRNRQRLRFKLIAYQDKRAKEDGSSDQEVRQQRHSHRPSPNRGPWAWYSKYGSGASSDLCCRSHPRRNSRPPVLDRHILCLDVAGFSEASSKALQLWSGLHSRRGMEKPNHRHCRLLPPRRERPRGCPTAEKGNEPAPVHVPP
jgi:hypothetical protein